MEEKEYLFLLKGLMSVVEKTKGIPYKNESTSSIEGLLLKFVLHCSTVFHISQGIDIPPHLKGVPDPGSLSVVSRAALECFIIFHYVFVTPANDIEEEFRYLAWKIKGFRDRQGYDLSSPQKRSKLRKESRDTLRHESEQIARLEIQLCQNALFIELSGKQKVALRRFGKCPIWDDNGNIPSWIELGVAAGLERERLKTFYSFLSGYAHASSLSVLQITEALRENCPNVLIEGTLSSLKPIIACMIVSYTELFPLSKTVLDNDSELNRTVKVWHYIGTHSEDEIENYRD